MKELSKDKREEAVSLIKLLKSLNREQQMGVLQLVQGAQMLKKESKP